MVKERISFAYASRILPGMTVDANLLPQILWNDIDPSHKHLIALTMGVVIDRSRHVDVTIEVTHEDSSESCIDESSTGSSQYDHFICYPDDRKEFLGISTLHVGGVSLKKVGMYTVAVKISENSETLDEIETCFFVANLKGQKNG